MEQQQQADSPVLFKPHKFQRQVLESRTRITLASSGVQSGKGLWQEEAVLTPAGWRRIGDIAEGDVLFDRMGKETKVLAVFRRGGQQCYRLTTTDGKSIITDGDHLWVIIDPHKRREHLVSTAVLFSLKNWWQGESKCRIPANEPVEMRHRNFLINPYIMGVLLGDGCLRNTVGVTISDNGILERVKTELPAGLKLKQKTNDGYVIIESPAERDKGGHGFNRFSHELRRMGLMGHYSYNKFIPDKYKLSSSQQRLDLLRGLMDTDGSICKNKTMEFYTTSEQLRDDFIFIVESLGGKCRVRKKTPYFRYKGGIKEGRKCFNIRIILRRFNPFHLSRKAGHYFRRENTENKVICNVERIGTLPTVCIKVDSPSETFIARGFMVTHNTLVGAAWSLQRVQEHNFKGTFLIAAPTYKLLNHSTLIKFHELVGGWKRIGVYRKADSEIILHGGEGRIFIRSCEEPDHLEGMTISGGAWLDEGGQMSEKVWINILGRTAIHRSPILVTTTPYLLNWVYRDIVIPAMKGDNEKTVVIWRSIDNPYFPQEEYEQRRLTMNENDFARRYCGEWRQASGLVFPEFIPEIHTIDPIKFKDDWKFYCGVDFGFRPNPTVAVWGAIDNQRNYWIVDEYREVGKTAGEHAEFLLKKEPLYHPLAYYCDPQGVEQINEFIAAGIRNVYGIKGKIKPGLEKITTLLKTNKIKIFNTCRGLIDELHRYHFKEQTGEGEMIEEPAKVDDHGVDAVRYLVVNTAIPEGGIYQRIRDPLSETGWSFQKWVNDQKEKEKRMRRVADAFGVDLDAPQSKPL